MLHPVFRRFSFPPSAILTACCLLLLCCKKAESDPTTAFPLEGFPAEMREAARAARASQQQELDRTLPRPTPPPSRALSKLDLLAEFDASAGAMAETVAPSADFAAATPLPQTEYTIADYAAEVEKELGKIPSFNPLELGQVLPIKLDDEELKPGQHTGETLCDKPALLGLGSDGQCVPYSRIGRLPGLNPTTGQPDSNIQWVFIARRYTIRTDPNFPDFEDVAIIGHNKATGATAFFQMLDEAGRNATRVPSPMEAATDTPSDSPTAEEFWLSPTKTAQIGCNRCHDSDPFVYSPYVRQATIKSTGTDMPLVPTDTKGRYKFIGSQAFSSWTAPMHFRPTANLCTTCHRIGVQESSSSFAAKATGHTETPQISEKYKHYPLSHWMPPGEDIPLTESEWKAEYEQSLESLLRCHANPGLEGCGLQAIPH